VKASKASLLVHRWRWCQGSIVFWFGDFVASPLTVDVEVKITVGVFLVFLKCPRRFCVHAIVMGCSPFMDSSFGNEHSRMATSTFSLSLTRFFQVRCRRSRDLFGVSILYAAPLARNTGADVICQFSVLSAMPYSNPVYVIVTFELVHICLSEGYWVYLQS